MRVTSNRGLARQLGVSETAVRRGERAGRIKPVADSTELHPLGRHRLRRLVVCGQPDAADELIWFAIEVVE